MADFYSKRSEKAKQSRQPKQPPDLTRAICEACVCCQSVWKSDKKILPNMHNKTINDE